MGGINPSLRQSRDVPTKGIQQSSTSSHKRYGSYAADPQRVRRSLLDKYQVGIEDVIEEKIQQQQQALGKNKVEKVRPPHRIPKIQQREQQPQIPMTPSENFSPQERQYALSPTLNLSPGNKIHTTSLSPEKELEGGSLHLVPCRWSLTGWKYVKMDPSDHTYFNSPHRVNGQGIYTGNASPENKKKLQNIIGGDNTSFDQRQWMKDGPNAEESGTTYSKYFSATK